MRPTPHLSLPFLRAVWTGAALLLLGSALAAQPVPSLERGVKPDKLYQFGDLDSVNVMNGNLLVRIPIGSFYPVGGGLSYGLGLIYNSKAWDFQEASFQGNLYSQALPDRLSNAGVGWSVTLGRLLSPTDAFNDNHPWQWTYIGPDGAQHLFYQGLQTVGPVGVDPCNSTCFTRDGSYIRMSAVSSTQKVIETADGIRRFFQRFHSARSHDRVAVDGDPRPFRRRPDRRVDQLLDGRQPLDDHRQAWPSATGVFRP